MPGTGNGTGIHDHGNGNCPHCGHHPHHQEARPNAVPVEQRTVASRGHRTGRHLASIMFDTLQDMVSGDISDDSGKARANVARTVILGALVGDLSCDPIRE